MPQVSRRRLPKRTWRSIWIQIIGAIKSVKTENDSQIFYTNLLSETEQIMLSKRFMCFLLFQSNWDVPDIAQKLNMSTSTLYKLQYQYKTNSKFRKLLKKLYPTPIPFDPDTPDKTFWDILFNEVLISKAESYRRWKNV